MLFAGRGFHQHRSLGKAAGFALQQPPGNHRAIHHPRFQQCAAAEARSFAAVGHAELHVKRIAFLDTRPQKAADDNERPVSRGENPIGVFYAAALHFRDEHRPLRRGFGIAAGAVQPGDEANRLDADREHAERHGQVADRMRLVVGHVGGDFRLARREQVPRGAAGQHRRGSTTGGRSVVSYLEHRNRDRRKKNRSGAGTIAIRPRRVNR